MVDIPIIRYFLMIYTEKIADYIFLNDSILYNKLINEDIVT